MKTRMSNERKCKIIIFFTKNIILIFKKNSFQDNTSYIFSIKMVKCLICNKKIIKMFKNIRNDNNKIRCSRLISFAPKRKLICNSS